MAEEHLEAVLAQGDQVLVEALVCQPQQLPQVQLGVGQWRGCYPGSGRACLPRPEDQCSERLQLQKHTQDVSVSAKHISQTTMSACCWVSPPPPPV